MMLGDSCFNYTIYGGVPDLARIGMIWTSSLVSINALMPFKPEEVAKFAGPDVFFKPIGRTASMPDDAKVWAIPFTAFNYVLFYRKDILEKVGLP